MDTCVKCRQELPDDGNHINCKGCSGSLHFECSTVSMKTYNAMSKSKKDEWRCDSCRNGSKISLLQKSVEKLENKVDQLLKKQESVDKFDKKLDEIIKSQEFISNQYDEAMKKLIEVTEKLTNIGKFQQEQDRINKEKDKEIEELKLRLNAVEQEQRNREIILRQVPENRDENLSQIICKISNKINLEMNLEDIESAYRIKSRISTGKANNEVGFIQSIALKFRSRTKRDLFSSLLKKANVKSADIMENGSNQYIRGYDMLTPYYRNLLFATKQRVIEKKWKFCWFGQNQVKCRKTEGSRVISILKESDLEKIL